MSRRLGRLCLAVQLAAPAALGAQTLDLSGYVLTLGTHAAETPLAPSGQTLVARARLMVRTDLGGLDVDAAYEHVATRSPAGGGFGITAPAGTASGSDWLGTDWSVRRTPRTDWRHRFDRLALGHAVGSLEIRAGRQAISWATTLVLTPADPFAPFDPADPFREYRGGVDAVRIRAFPGPFTELEAVVRPTETPFGTTTTALARAQTSVGGWAVGGWAGALHDEAAGALFATGSLGSSALRAEASLRDDGAGGVTLRAAAGIDRYLTPAGRDMVLLVEVLYDGFGADDPSRLFQVALSEPFQRGDMQALSRWAAATTASYQLHPLVGAALTALVSPTDGSALLSSSVSWSASSAASVSVGAFTGIGDGLSPTGGIGSEFGAVPNLGYASVSWYF